MTDRLAVLMDRVEQRLVAVSQTINECAKGAEPDEPAPCHLCMERQVDAVVIRELRDELERLLTAEQESESLHKES